MRFRTLLIGSCAGALAGAVSMSPWAGQASVGTSQLSVAPSGSLAVSTSADPFNDGIGYQALLVDPVGAVGGPAMPGVDTTRPWAALFEVVAPGAGQAAGPLLCTSMSNPTTWRFDAATTRVGAPVAAFDAVCPDGRYHIEWDYLYTGWGWSAAEQLLSSVSDTMSQDWGFVSGPMGQLRFSTPGFVVTQLHICKPGGCATEAQWQTVYPTVNGLISLAAGS